MEMAYFTLLCRDNKEAAWEIAFGDFDKDTVQSELDDYRDHDYQKQNLRIVQTRTSRQSEIDNIIRKLNHGRK
jgi:hypothetical protein